MAEQDVKLHPAHDAVMKACEDAQFTASAAGMSGHALQVHGFLAMLEAYFKFKAGGEPVASIRSVGVSKPAPIAATEAPAAQITDDTHE